MSLRKAGYSLELIAPNPTDELVNGVKVISVPPPRGRRSRFTRTAWQVYKKARQSGARIFHFHDPELLPYGLLLSFGRRKIVYDVHENVPNTVLERQWVPDVLRGPLARAVASLERLVAARCAAVVVADPVIGERFSKKGRAVLTLENFPRLEEFSDCNELKTEESCKSIVSFGGIHRNRCPFQMVEAMGLLSVDARVRLVLGGRCEEPDLLSRLQRSKGWHLTDYVGPVTRNKMINYLGDSSVAIVMYSPSPNHYEIRSNRLYEAMAASNALVVSDFPSWRELVERYRCGIAVDPTDPRAVAEGINHLLSNPNETAEMGRRARRAVVEGFNWAAEEKRLLELYRSLIES